jgi:hypothetical protein
VPDSRTDPRHPRLPHRVVRGVVVPFPTYPNNVYAYGTIALIVVGILLTSVLRPTAHHVDQSEFQEKAA